MAVDWTTVGTVATCVGALGSVLSAAFTGLLFSAAKYGFSQTERQIENLQQSLRSGVSEQLMNGSFQVIRFLSEHKGFYACFYDNGKVQDPKEAEYLNYASEMMANYLEHVLSQLKVNAIPPDARQSWEQFVKDVVDNSEVLRIYVDRNRKWYSSELKDMVHQVDPSLCT